MKRAKNQDVLGVRYKRSRFPSGNDHATRGTHNSVCFPSPTSLTLVRHYDVRMLPFIVVALALRALCPPYASLHRRRSRSSGTMSSVCFLSSTSLSLVRHYDVRMLPFIDVALARQALCPPYASLRSA